MVYLDDLDGLLFEADNNIYLINVDDEDYVSFINMETGDDESSMELLRCIVSKLTKDARDMHNISRK